MTTERQGDIAQLGQIALENDLYEHDGILRGTLRFLRKPAGQIDVQWIDSSGRVAGQKILAAPTSLALPLSFTFDLRPGLTYVNSIRVKVDGVIQACSARFMRSPAATSWNDYQVISWAHYPDGYFYQLRSVGVNATIAYREGDFSTVLNNDFNFYVEQMAWEVFAIYHKELPLWRELISKVRSDRSNLKHWVRTPCLNDPETQKYVREHLQNYVRQHRAYRPLYYTIADELGQGDQISANDFCHSRHCALAFSEYLRKGYGSLQGVRLEWTLSEVIRWDDEGLRSGNDWEKSRLMIDLTTTDLAFEAIALANLNQRYPSLSEFNKQWGTSFPEPRGGGMSPREIWEPVIGAARESLSIPDLTEAALEKALGPLDQFNLRCGNRAGWNTPQKPTGFKNWTEVKSFLVRYDKELGDVESTKGWNAAPWSDFRNFMDATFADAVLRAAEVCKAEDPHARCATEGGQAPFAFGWYNYEQVLRVVDVIEPYNIGNNVEVIRSLKPATIMLSTVGFDHKPGTPMTDADRLRQKQAVRPVWWELFHSHQGTIIWDNQEETGTFVDLKTGQVTVSGDTFSSVFTELRSGLAMLIMHSLRTQDGIAIHYSHPSIQAHWLLENVKKARHWMVNTVEAYVTSRFIAVRNSWTKLIEDLQLQYDFVSATQVAAGELNSGRFKVFIMPESIAISAAEAEQIREFVQRGGLLIGDHRAGLLNDHCRDIGPQLNDVFGIADGPAMPQGPGVKGEGSQGSLDLTGKELKRIVPADRTVKATTGKPLAHSGAIPMIIANQLGSGQALYLNMDVSGYAFDRLNPDASSTMPDLMESILGLGQVGPRIRILGANNKRLPGTEIVHFTNGNLNIVAIFRNPQLDDGGWGSYAEKKSDWRDWTTDADNSAFEKSEETTIEWGASLQTYDVRAHKDLGVIGTYKTVLSPWEPLVFTRSPRPLAKLQCVVSEKINAGSLLETTITADDLSLEGTSRVVRLEFAKPSGDTYSSYSQNILVTSLPHTVRTPIAFNDPVGSWRVRAHDLLAGSFSEGVFQVLPSTGSQSG